MQLNKRWYALLLLIVWSVAGTTACTGRFLSEEKPPAVIKARDFVVVTVAPEDTFASLAKTYLKDADKAWRISTYNDLAELKPGRQIVIPLKPFAYGGLRLTGYQTVPVLLYDRIETAAQTKNGISIYRFEQQAQYLKSNGFTTVSLDDFYEFLSLKDQLPPKAVVICFDGTGRWIYETAFPICKQYDLRVGLFISARAVGQKDQLTWEELAELTAAGFSIGSKGMTGQDLAGVNKNETAEAYIKRVEDEIRDSRKEIESKLKKACPYFAYPLGNAGDLVIALLKQHGYCCAFTREKGDNPFFVDNFRIHRTQVTGQMNLLEFQKSLTTFQAAELK